MMSDDPIAFRGVITPILEEILELTSGGSG
jgi:hypothetical protein